MRGVILNHLYRESTNPNPVSSMFWLASCAKSLPKQPAAITTSRPSGARVMCSATRPRCRLRHGSEPRGSHYASAARLLGAPLDCVRGSFEEPWPATTRKNISECDALHTLCPFGDGLNSCRPVRGGRAHIGRRGSRGLALRSRDAAVRARVSKRAIDARCCLT